MLEDLKNRFDFFIRNKTRFSRKNFVEKKSKMIERNRLENLYIKDILSKSFLPAAYDSIRVLDIGCKNWFYAKAEHEFFNERSLNVTIDGIELDAYRLYSNFYSRYEVAKYYIKDLSGVNYIVGNLLDINKKYDYITWFLPFVSIEPLMYWGLPKVYFCPNKMMEHAYNILNEGGSMLIVNQGEQEMQLQRNILEALGIAYEYIGELKSEYFEYKNKRFGFLIRK